MKRIVLFLFFSLLQYALYCQYISSTVEQVSAPVFSQGSVNNPVIRIKIETGPNLISLYALFLTTNGSTNPANDIDSAKIFYTGSSNVFSSSSQYGATVSNPNSGFTINFTLPLSAGTNYFWVTYDISATAIVCDSMDATCYTVYVSSGTQTPYVTDPLGISLIGSCPTGLNEENNWIENNFLLFPNPSSGILNIQFVPSNGVSEIIVRNIFGQQVFSVPVSNLQIEIQLNISEWNDGIYFISFQSEKSIQSQKMIINKH